MSLDTEELDKFQAGLEKWMPRFKRDPHGVLTLIEGDMQAQVIRKPNSRWTWRIGWLEGMSQMGRHRGLPDIREDFATESAAQDDLMVVLLVQVFRVL